MPYVRLFVPDKEVALLRKVADGQNAYLKERDGKLTNSTRWTWRSAADNALSMGIEDLWASGEYDDEGGDNDAAQ